MYFQEKELVAYTLDLNSSKKRVYELPNPSLREKIVILDMSDKGKKEKGLA